MSASSDFMVSPSVASQGGFVPGRLRWPGISLRGDSLFFFAKTGAPKRP